MRAVNRNVPLRTDSVAGALCLAFATLYGYGLANAAQAEALTAPPAAQELSNAFASVSEMASKAVVFIEVEKEVSRSRQMPWAPGGGPSNPFFEYFFGPQGPQGRQGRPEPRDWQGPRGPRGPRDMQEEEPGERWVPFGQGSGFLISEDGYIVTNHHVVGEADRVNVTLGDGREFEAERVGTDPHTEIALIKIEGGGFPFLTMADSDQLRIGEWVLAIGSPFGLSNTVTAGIVGARGRGALDIVDYADFIQTDAAINPGNSGGPLLNLRGEVVGLNTAILSRSGGYMGIGFAVPANMVKYVRDQLLEKGTISRGFLGISIQNVDQNLANWFGIKDGHGVLIAGVNPGSPASEAGLQRDDVIVEYEGQPIQEANSFRSRVSTTAPGSRVSIVVIRDGERLTKTVTLGEMEGDEAVASASRARGRMSLGLRLDNLSEELAERLGYENESGVVVQGVAPGSAAEAAGIEPGMLIKEVNRKAVRNTTEFTDALKEGEGRKSALLLLQEGEYTRYVTLPTDR